MVIFILPSILGLSFTRKLGHCHFFLHLLLDSTAECRSINCQVVNQRYRCSPMASHWPACYQSFYFLHHLACRYDVKLWPDFFNLLWILFYLACHQPTCYGVVIFILPSLLGKPMTCKLVGYCLFLPSLVDSREACRSGTCQEHKDNKDKWQCWSIHPMKQVFGNGCYISILIDSILPFVTKIGG